MVNNTIDVSVLNSILAHDQASCPPQNAARRWERDTAYASLCAASESVDLKRNQSEPIPDENPECRLNLAGVLARLQAPDVRPGLAMELRQHKALLETEITELTVGTTSHDPMALILTALVLVLRDHLGSGAQ